MTDFLLFAGIDFKSMPPCKAVLCNKIKRSNYIASMIKHANENFIQFDVPGEHGWKSINNEFVIDYYDGPQYPENFEDENLLDNNADDDLYAENSDNSDNFDDELDFDLSESDDDF